MNPVDVFEAELTRPCPFCGGTIGVVRDPPGVMHSMPPCPKFAALDPADFLHAVNLALGNLQ